MKRTIIVVIMMVLITAVMAETVKLKNGESYEGNIVGKQAGFLYLRTDDGYYKIQNTLIEDILNSAGFPITRITQRKKDFISFDPKKDEFTIIINKMVDLSAVNLTNIDTMSEREFQIYLHQKSNEEIKNVTAAINSHRNSLWLMWGFGIAGGVVAILIAGG